jgi:LmbE family N-acetylglucosaminyl deacetylase
MQKVHRFDLARRLLCLALVIGSLPAAAQVRPIYDRGSAGLAQLLLRLQTTSSAMLTGAHPDVEDSGLLARLSRGDHARVAYLSLTRGDGGQNVIGEELFEPLGVIRTEELLQARRLDGADQFFTRAYDFGFTKTLDEAKQKWGEQPLLEDMVRAIRLYRPLVLISRFSGTPADGHGQHQMAGYLTPIAFRMAGDPKAFPEQIEEGLLPWQPLKLYEGQRFRSSGNPNEEPTLRLETGIYDPLLGRTYYQIAAEGRSQHKTQQMGNLELRGEHSSGVRLVQDLAGPLQQESSLFDGLDTSVVGIEKIAGLQAGRISQELKQMQSEIAEASKQFDAYHPERISALLARALEAERTARAKLKDDQAVAARNADFLLQQKEAELERAIQESQAVVVDVLADRETVVPGESFNVSLRVFVPEGSQVKVTAPELHLPAGWSAQQASASSGDFRTEATPYQWYFKVQVPADAAYTQPYWLNAPRDGYLFRWSKNDPKDQPFAPPLVSGSVSLQFAGVEFEAEKTLQYRYDDDIRGEIRRDLNVVPAISLQLDDQLLIIPSSANQTHRRVGVTVTSNAEGNRAAVVKLALPQGWRSTPESITLTFKQRGEHGFASFDVVVPGGTKAGNYAIGVSATSGGHDYDRIEQTIAYPHIQTHRIYRPAEIKAEVVDLKVAPVNVGYIMGSGDQVPEAIRRMGLPVTLLGEQDLASGDLSRFDVIVVGVRASQVRPDLAANHHRLMDYIHDGGTLIVQYQQGDYTRAGLTPYPARIDPAPPQRARVTDEDAPVKILAPQHPAFNYPNRIIPADWQGWVQERNLYNFTQFDPHYQALLECADPGEAPQDGGEVYLEYGKGKYVYTSYAWFRQLPAGVPGAYRLFADLLSLAKAPAHAKP